jgi:hypothetical protein
MEHEQINELFLEYGIECIQTPGPVFEIGKDLVTKQWKLVDARNSAPELRKAEMNSCSTVKLATAKIIRLDGGRLLVDDESKLCLHRSDDDLIVEWVKGVAAEMKTAPGHLAPLFIWTYPVIIQLPLYTIDSFAYESSCMTHGVEENIFARRDIVERQVKTLFGRIHHEDDTQ